MENASISDKNGEKQRNTILGGEGRLGRSDFERAYMEIINRSSV